jgi:hypothetical protein
MLLFRICQGSVQCLKRGMRLEPQRTLHALSAKKHCTTHASSPATIGESVRWLGAHDKSQSLQTYKHRVFYTTKGIFYFCLAQQPRAALLQIRWQESRCSEAIPLLGLSAYSWTGNFFSKKIALHFDNKLRKIISVEKIL